MIILVFLHKQKHQLCWVKVCLRKIEESLELWGIS